MAADRFNEAETYLIENWQKACLVEKSLTEIRLRYTGIGDRVLEVLQGEHKGLDQYENSLKSNGCLSIGREKWQNDGNYACIGCENLTLEELTDNRKDPPFIGIWTGKPKKPAMDVEAINRLRSAARDILTSDQLVDCGCDPTDLEADSLDCEFLYDLNYDLPEKKEDMIKMLLDGDGQKFVDCLVEHFRVFAKFIPMLDEVYHKPMKK